MADLRATAHGPRGTVLVNYDRIECAFIRQAPMGDWEAEIYLCSGKVIATKGWSNRESLAAMIKHGLDTETSTTPDAEIRG